jgi:RNA polymerase sigma factor (sigma-70 family)
MGEPPALAEGSWDSLLDFLDPSRSGKQGRDRDEVAEAKYLEIVRKLTCFFAGRGCRDPEDLAVTTALRVAARCGSVDSAGFADPTGYFYGVAKNVLHEAQRDALRDARHIETLRAEFVPVVVPDPRAWRQKEAVQRCLDRCMAKLSERPRKLLLAYYAREGREKIEEHRSLADEFGKSVNALRIEIHRTRKTVRECVFACVGHHVGTATEKPLAVGAER